ncbi:MAG: hypothetical protein AAFV98_23335 [Chloroflexota bacterium]
MNKLLGVLSALMLLLTACNTNSVAIPLADDRPTFLYFYTDG